MSDTKVGEAGNCPVCGEFMREPFTHLRAAHPTGDWGPYSSSAKPSVGFDARVAIGISRRVAYALAIYPDDVVPRAFVRSVLPENGVRRPTAHNRLRRQGRGGGGRNRTSLRFHNALKGLEEQRLIRRGETHVQILDRSALFGLATDGVGDEERVEWIVIEWAVEPAREAVRAAMEERTRRQALRELQNVYDLMKRDAGVWAGGRRSVRHVPHGWRGRPS